MLLYAYAAIPAWAPNGQADGRLNELLTRDCGRLVSDASQKRRGDWKLAKLGEKDVDFIFYPSPRVATDRYGRGQCSKI